MSKWVRHRRFWVIVLYGLIALLFVIAVYDCWAMSWCYLVGFWFLPHCLGAFDWLIKRFNGW